MVFIEVGTSRYLRLPALGFSRGILAYSTLEANITEEACQIFTHGHLMVPKTVSNFLKELCFRIFKIIKTPI